MLVNAPLMAVARVFMEANSTKTNQGRNESVFNQVLTGFVVDQVVQQSLEVLHVFVLLLNIQLSLSGHWG